MRNTLRVPLVLISLLAGSFFPACPAAIANAPQVINRQPDPGRFRYDLIAAWRRAVARHEPGELDQAATGIEEWPKDDLQTVIRQVRMLAKLVAASPTRALKLPIQSLLGLTIEEIKTGNANRILKRGALLHTDIAILAPVRAPESPRETARYLVDDGRVIGLKVDPHWEYARLLLDSVEPKPSLDGMVLQWYRATSADMQNRHEWGTSDDHLDRARKIFPSDARILFYSGTLHEFYAGTFAQNTRITAPPRSRMEFGSKESELARAQGFFHEAVAQEPEFGEAHLRLGRVTGLLGDHARAVVSLRQAASALEDPLLQYYAALFLGWENEMLGNYDAAREQYQGAATLYPTSQSPLLALTHLMRWTEYYPETLARLEPVLMEPGWTSEREDPWWNYEVAHVRDAGRLMGEMRLSFGGLPK